jgi:hypothetical protein
MDELLVATKALDPDFLSQRDLSHLLGFSERKLARLHAMRKGPPRITLGKKVFYYKPAVVAWMVSLQQADTSPKTTYRPREPRSQKRQTPQPSAQKSSSDGHRGAP